MRFLLIGLATLTLASCSQPADRAGGASGGKRMYDMELADVAATDAAASAGPAADGAASAPASPGPVIPAGPPMLAYEYDYGIETPAKQVKALMARHETACAAAGQSRCQVVASNLREIDEDRLGGTLELRASPVWLKTFRDGVGGEAKAAGGRIISSQVTSEDLSRQIVDTEARLRAMTTLRDRLQALLASRPGKLSDLVEIERELARVQGDIDSSQSQLAVMRGRVTMSSLTIRYSSTGTIAPRGVWSPLVGAFTDFIGIVAFTLAAMVRLIAWLLPWVLIGGGLLWVFRKRLPRPFWRRREKPADS